MSYLAQISGVIGLLIITRAVFIKREGRRDWAFALGGLFLLAYSVYLKDYIFIILQLVFIVSNIYQEYKLKNLRF